MTGSDPDDASRPDAGGCDVAAVLAEQARLQVRVLRQRMPRWVPWTLLVGIAISVTGFVVLLLEFEARGSPYVSATFFGLFVASISWAGLNLLLWPRLAKARIVPCFARGVGELNGESMAAFRRGRGLHAQAAALERLASALVVTPLSAFGFADDHYGQAIRWHPAREGLASVEALRGGLDARLRADPHVAGDLDALAVALRPAAEVGVDFCLVLRLHARDNLQMVCTREVRQGSFW